MGSNRRRINDMRPALLLWHIKWAPHLTVNNRTQAFQKKKKKTNRTQENEEMIWVLFWCFIHLKHTLFDLSAECRILHNNIL